jgi:hypothetical protein
MANSRGRRTLRRMLQEAGLSRLLEPPLPAPTPPQSIWAMIPKWIYGFVTFFLASLALIAFLPRLSVSAALPSDPNEQLASSTFTVLNDGHVPVTDVKSACYLWKVQGENGVHSTANIQGNVGRVVIPPASILRPTEGYTVPCTSEKMFYFSPPLIVKHADIAIIVYYRPWPFTFLRSHRLYRFVARMNPQGQITSWDKQPAAQLEPDFEHWLKEHPDLFNR